jgi:hypothetical protein
MDGNEKVLCESSRFFLKFFDLSPCNDIEVIEGRILLGLGISGRHMRDVAKERVMVGLIDSGQGDNLCCGGARPGPLPPDAPGLVEAIDSRG